MPKRFTHKVLICLILILTVFFNQNINAATIADFIVPANFTFKNDLIKNRTVFPDIMFLQNILNMSTSTRVAEKGPGSNGILTSYYGEKTEDAVGRFQEIFKADIEYEKSILGNSASQAIDNDRVDVYTRTVLNKLILIYSNQRYMFKNGVVFLTPNSISTSSATTTLPFSTTTVFQTGANDNQQKDTPEKTLFKYSPNGMLLKVIGGNSLVDKVYSYTPSGMLGGGGGGGGAPGSFSVGGSSAAITPFGGFVTAMTYCTCSFNILLYVKDPRGPVLPLIYQPGATILYKMYTPMTGVNVLGRYTSGGQCLVYAGSGCATGGVPLGTMIQLGTSAL